MKGACVALHFWIKIVGYIVFFKPATAFFTLLMKHTARGFKQVEQVVWLVKSCNMRKAEANLTSTWHRRKVCSLLKAVLGQQRTCTGFDSGLYHSQLRKLPTLSLWSSFEIFHLVFSQLSTKSSFKTTNLSYVYITYTSQKKKLNTHLRLISFENDYRKPVWP